MPRSAKRGFREWFGLFLVIVVLLSIPTWVLGVTHMVRETHWTWVLILVIFGFGCGWNCYLIKRWWNPEAYKFKW